MECLIKKALVEGCRKKARIEVLARYLRIKYHINMDLKSLKARFDQVSKEQMAYAGLQAERLRKPSYF